MQVSIKPLPESWSSHTPLLILDISRSLSVIDVTFELSTNNNRFSIVYDTVDYYDTNRDRNRPEGPLIIRWDRELILRPKLWVVQYTEQPECFLIFRASVSISRDIPIVQNCMRPFSGSFKALRRHITEIKESGSQYRLWRAEKSAKSSAVRIEGSEGSISVRVRRIALRLANRAILDLDTYCFWYKLHIDYVPDI